MTELEKIAYAKSFIDKLANGINPIDNSVIPCNDVVKNVRLSRCFSYVSDILGQVISNGGTTPLPKEKKNLKQPYFITAEQAAQFEYSDIPITATEIYNRILSIGPQDDEVKKLPKKKITKWLYYLDLLEVVEINNTRISSPTESGKELGILLEKRQGQYGEYYVVLYNRDAQQFILDNIEAVLAFEKKAYREKMHLDNQCKPWNKEQSDKAVTLFNEGFSIKDIAYELKRSEKSISIHLRKSCINIDNIVDAKPFRALDETLTMQASEGVKESAKTEATCQNCRFARSGDCFPKKEICADYEKAYDVSNEERALWPEMGDASYIRQKGRFR